MHSWSKDVDDRPLRLGLNSGTGFGAIRKMLIDVLAQQCDCRKVAVTESYSCAVVESGSGTYSPICLKCIPAQPRSRPQTWDRGFYCAGTSGSIPKIRPVQLRISGLVDVSTCCRGGWIKDNGVLSPIAL
jgi:hypothetical protein